MSTTTCVFKEKYCFFLVEKRNTLSEAVILRIHTAFPETSRDCTNQGPVVQSVVSLTSSLRVISLTVLVDSIYNILIFFAEKM